MKIFTKMLLVTSVLMPAVAVAETIPAISYNPSRAGYYSYLKVVSLLSFSPQVNVTHLSLEGKPKLEASEIDTTSILPQTGTTNHTIDFYHTAKLKNADIEMQGGNLYVQNGTLSTITISQPQDEGVIVTLPSYAEKTAVYPGATFKVTTDRDATGSIIGEKNNQGSGKNYKLGSTIKGWKLGSNTIPTPPVEVVQNKRYCWKSVSKIGGQDTSTNEKVLTLTSQCNY